jgi:hypothetical protein
MRTWIAVCVGVAVLVAVCVLGAGRGYPAARITVQAWDAWVTTDPTGDLTLIDGSNAAVVGSVHIAHQGDPLTAVQDGSDAYAADQHTRMVSEVNAATMTVSARTGPVPGRSTLQVLAGRGGVYAAGSKIEMFGPGTLRLRGAPLPGPAKQGTTVLDRAGSLWTLSGAGRGGGLIRLTPGTAGQRPLLALATTTTPGDQLTTAVGAAVLVDPAREIAEMFSPRTGIKVGSVRLRPGLAAAVVSGSSIDPEIYLVVPSARQDEAALSTCLFRRKSCGPAREIGSANKGCPSGSSAAGEPFGAAVEAAGFIYVPDYVSGVIYVLPAEGGAPTEVRAVGPCHLFDLFSKDGVVFFNDPAGPTAGVAGPGARIRIIEKYRPRNRVPARVTTAPLRLSAPPATSAPPASQAPSPGADAPAVPSPTPSATPTPTPTPTGSAAPVRRQGTLVMTGWVSYDLDSLAADWDPSNAPGGADANENMRYEAESTGNGVPLLVIAGAPDSFVLLPPGGPWTAQTCLNAGYGLSRQDFPDGAALDVGRGFCVQTANTAEGKTDGCHLALLVVKASTPLVLTFEVTVWDIRPPGPLSGGQC